MNSQRQRIVFAIGLFSLLSHLTIAAAVRFAPSVGRPFMPLSARLQPVALQSTPAVPTWDCTGTEAGCIGHVLVEPAAGALTPAGFALFSYRSGGVLVTEDTVPASPLIQSGRILVEISGRVSTGIALANPSSQDTAVSYYFTDSTGKDLRSGTLTLKANQQLSAFMNEAPFNGSNPFWGTFTFVASARISAIALRGFTNERNEFLITTIPVSPITSISGNETLVIPHFANDAGWYTQIILVNPRDVALSGKVEFFGDGSSTSSGRPERVWIDGVNSSSFNYTIAPKGLIRFATQTREDREDVGSVRVTPAASSTAPYGVGLFSYKNRGITVSETSVPMVSSGSAFRLYVESSQVWGRPGSVRTGVTIANPSASPLDVQLRITSLDGKPTGFSSTVRIPAGGNLARFIDELFPKMPDSFRGILRASASRPFSLTGLRSVYNERRDFLISSVPPVNEASVPNNAPISFPHIVTGQGYTTQLILVGNAPGTATGKVWFRSRTGVLLPGTSMRAVE